MCILNKRYLLVLYIYFIYSISIPVHLILYQFCVLSPHETFPTFLCFYHLQTPFPPFFFSGACLLPVIVADYLIKDVNHMWGHLFILTSGFTLPRCVFIVALPCLCFPKAFSAMNKQFLCDFCTILSFCVAVSAHSLGHLLKYLN